MYGVGHSSHSVNHTVPTAQGQSPHAAILKIPESERTTRDHLHLRVEPFSDPIGFGEALHPHNGLGPNGLTRLDFN